MTSSESFLQQGDRFGLQKIYNDIEWSPAGHPKLLHLWPVKLPQAGRSDYAYSAAVAMREAASFRR